MFKWENVLMRGEQIGVIRTADTCLALPKI